MFFFLLQLQLQLLLCQTTMGRETALKRQVLYNRPDGQRLISVSMSGATTEAAQMLVLLVFSGARQGAQRQYHNALLMNPRHVSRYTRVTGRQQQLTVLSKGESIDMKYQVALPNESFTATTSSEYDALLSLDYDSSIWNEYDTALFEQSLLTLKMSPEIGDGDSNGASIKAKRQFGDDEDQGLRDYLGTYRLNCEGGTYRGGHDECVVSLDGLWINGAAPETTGRLLVVDLDSPVNLLPLDLFLRWQFHGEREFFLTAPALGGELYLMLNRQFQYQLNEESDDIVLGLDLVHYFQRVSYSAHRGRLVLWYSRIYASNPNFQLSKSLIYWFISLILTCLASWLASPNYDVLDAVLARHHTFGFPFQMVIVELTSLALAPLLWTLVLASGDAWTNAYGLFRHSTVLQREQLIFFMALYHWILSLALVARGGELVKLSFRHYWHYFGSFVRKPGRYDKALAERETEIISVKAVLLRNLAGHALMETSFLMITNYLSEEKLIYNVPYIVASLALVFFYLKTLGTIVVYVAQQGGVRREPLFCLISALSAVAFFIFVGLGIHLNYVGIFLLLNAVYSTNVVKAATWMLLSFVAVAGVYSVYLPLTRHVNRKLKPLLIAATTTMNAESR